jgi:hypothetical protein
MNAGEPESNWTALGILNGCSTAVGKDCQSFIEALSRDGFCGFLGTESEIPNVFALRFGSAFLNRLLVSGHPLVQVVDELRREHWPLSLLYGLYGYPLLQIVPSAGGTAIIGCPANFSRGPLGAAAL